MIQTTVVGAGLAGCEAAWQLAKQGIKVNLIEMKPEHFTPAHSFKGFCELVCSNSLRSNQIENAVGLLKEEMRRLDSLVMSCADKTSVPAGSALAVDREGFSKLVTKTICECPNIHVVSRRIDKIPTDTPVIVATGPLSTPEISDDIKNLVGKQLYFYDAAAPIVTAQSIDMDIAFLASRYSKGTPDYINCPMTKDEYNAFYDALVSAEETDLHEFDKLNVFEGCMPVEVMAKRSREALLFGPLKPVGLIDPRGGKEPYAVVQLRQDNAAATLYNLVGFQTHLKFLEQKRVFSMIPGLGQAEFVRYGVMHRNTFLNSPKLLDRNYALRNNPNIVFAGQMTGVEGYVESASSGLVAGLNLARRLKGLEMIVFPKETAIGALCLYISDESIEKFQPMNVNFGIMPPLDHRIKSKRDKNIMISKRSLDIIDEIVSIML